MSMSSSPSAGSMRRHGISQQMRQLVIRDMAVEAGCEKPELVSTTKMRKYTPTTLQEKMILSQLLGLEEGEIEWMSNNLRHNIDIHGLSYRLRESTIDCQSGQAADGS
ncbi:hypothetical protein HOLleu_44180 [Holothuria leucospilota]|uniref:Uncharacterized protein n=1 Tax=Holothuria leucospilota TaxID=206669 RepID=A0A9Q0YB51_HOLLE|nr:hypothetical protein HOLleu_44180 [Holothuria leucospilota]